MTRIGEHKIVSTKTSRSKSLSWYYKNTSDTLVSTRSDRLVSTRSDTLVSSRWSSSERPLFVRTVWSGGIRHAILSLDDPLLGQTASGTIRHHQTSSDTFRHLQTQSGIIRHHQTSSSRHHRTSALDRNLSSANTTASEETLSTSSGTHEEDPKRGCGGWEEANFHQHRRRSKQKVKKKKKYGCTHPMDNNPEPDKVTTFDDSTFPETRFMLGEESRNALSERVLQWLDLANKAAKSGGNSSGKSRILAKRINTALPGAYYLEPPNYLPPGNHLKKITKRCMEDYAAPTETEMDLDRSSPRRFSLQGSTHPPSIDPQKSSPRRSSLQATTASSHPNYIRKGFDAEMSRINPQRSTTSAHPLRRSFDQSSAEFLRHQSSSSTTPSYPEETDDAAKITHHRTTEPRPATVHNRCYLNCTETDDTSHHRTIAPRVGNAWTRTMSAMPSRPQLHIFMPNLPPHARVASFDGSDCLSNSGCEQAATDG